MLWDDDYVLFFLVFVCLFCFLWSCFEVVCPSVLLLLSCPVPSAMCKGITCLFVCLFVGPRVVLALFEESVVCESEIILETMWYSPSGLSFLRSLSHTYTHTHPDTDTDKNTQRGRRIIPHWFSSCFFLSDYTSRGRDGSAAHPKSQPPNSWSPLCCPSGSRIV